MQSVQSGIMCSYKKIDNGSRFQNIKPPHRIQCSRDGNNVFAWSATTLLVRKEFGTCGNVHFIIGACFRCFVSIITSVSSSMLR